MSALLFTVDTTFWYQTHRVFGTIFYGGADFNGAMTTADRIAAGDYDSWKREWAATAERVEDEARAGLAACHPVSARDSLMRATSYWRSAEVLTRDRKPDPDGESHLVHLRRRRWSGDSRTHRLPSTPLPTPQPAPMKGTTMTTQQGDSR